MKLLTYPLLSYYLLFFHLELDKIINVFVNDNVSYLNYTSCVSDLVTVTKASIFSRNILHGLIHTSWRHKQCHENNFDHVNVMQLLVHSNPNQASIYDLNIYTLQPAICCRNYQPVVSEDDLRKVTK